MVPASAPRAETLRQALHEGRWPWAERTLLAPMEGVTHAGYRALIAGYGGVGVVCTEFFRITRGPLNLQKLEADVVRTPHAALSVQVMGDDERNMALATERVVASGTDIVDINLGCPAPNAVRKGVGAQMLERPQVLERVVRSMRARTRGPLSAKMRAGVAVSDRAVETACLLEAWGVDFITVHPRRSVDRYERCADHRITKAIKDAVSIPVVANGDLWFAAEADQLMRETRCDAVMMGRPVLRNPWLFAQLKALSRAERMPEPDGAALLAHVHAYIAATPARTESALLGLVKEQLRYLLTAVREQPDLLREALRQTSVAGLLCRLESRLGAVAARGLDLGPRPKP